jgi:hypothetical protein
MKNSVKVFIMLLAFAAVINTSCFQKDPCSGWQKLSKKIIQAMTPEEKAYFVTAQV